MPDGSKASSYNRSFFAAIEASVVGSTGWRGQGALFVLLVDIQPIHSLPGLTQPGEVILVKVVRSRELCSSAVSWSHAFSFNVLLLGAGSG